jgi:hypothetical protein
MAVLCSALPRKDPIAGKLQMGVGSTNPAEASVLIVKELLRNEMPDTGVLKLKVLARTRIETLVLAGRSRIAGKVKRSASSDQNPWIRVDG